ncbi:MAG TPA: redoxin domain-containing protein [Bryobacteraceae bacterium]|nr:redoxin domain-containing protein [Bryobacteraceae bacterium]
MRRVCLVMLAAGAALAAGGDIVSAVRSACDARDFTLAIREIQSYRMTAGATPDLVEALSWLARGELDAKDYDDADRYAAEARELCLETLKHGGVAPPQIATALGASIEVRAQALAGRGRHSEALAFLRSELATWRQTPLAERIQKNINLLALVGKPAPALDAAHWLGSRPPSLAALKGHPVLLFFWAHWCSDCKAEVPILARLMQVYGPQGLVLVGPTQLYGYTAAGDAAPEAETRYIEQVRQHFYASLAGMTVPLSKRNFENYGCSTTPTLVLLDASGIVRMYHPGAMSYDALADRISQVAAPHHRS